MRYAIKHAYSVSEDEYQGTMLEPLFGTGQGSGSSPAIWLGLVVILLNTFDRIAAEYHITGFEFDDPWNEVAATWNVGAFVDDTNQGVTDYLRKLSPRPGLCKHSAKAVRYGRTYYISLVALSICRSVSGHSSSGSGTKAALDSKRCPRMIHILQ